MAVLIAVLTALAMIILMPLWWMISTSLKSLNEIMSYPPTWIPESFHWENYRLTWSRGNFTRYTLNTLLLAGVGVITHVLSNTFIAYGFAKIKFPGRQMLFTVMLGTMMIPGFVTLIPTYIMFAKIHWVGTYLPLMVPGLFGSAYQIFLVRQFYMSIPNELIEAGKIDGASHYYIWWKIMIPLAKPAVVVIAIMTFQGAWNDFLGPLIYISKESMFNLQIGLQSFKGQETTQWHYLMAGSLIVLAPVIALFFFFQRYFIEGMNISSGTKG
ncbi:multiple sugar transport system permease protein [Paenibacillus rhizosphaerae]|uniref:Multiple sugar transport system permease protein n=1 Tax=Paenibacillus rhizosphaerae TaxID=297318 RepID=A0A839TPV2_9BACL|nr:carbohydrate ABC transporter permease [Paenibacillus rhizosphaerae]MBB3128591.1 multiple sugar transport system permease protein [Paenibacillus rhizosphaerae]